LLLSFVFYISKQQAALQFEKNKKLISAGAVITNFSLLVFWISLLGSGFVKISGKLTNLPFAQIMQNSAGWFKLFAISGIALFAGLLLLLISGINTLKKKQSAKLSLLI